MIRVFCSTNTCTMQAAQLCHAAQREATLAAVTAERDALAAALEAEREGKQFYEQLFSERTVQHGR